MPYEKEEEIIPEVEPGLEEVPVTPEKDIDKKPKLPPEKIQEIIDNISNEEKEEKEHERQVNEIIKKIHQ